MLEFLLRKITEAHMFGMIKKLKKAKHVEAIYLCASVVLKKFQGKGLSTIGFVKAIKRIIGKSKLKPTLFYEAYSKSGEAVAKKVSKILKLPLISRK